MPPLTIVAVAADYCGVIGGVGVAGGVIASPPGGVAPDIPLVGGVVVVLGVPGVIAPASGAIVPGAVAPGAIVASAGGVIPVVGGVIVVSAGGVIGCVAEAPIPLAPIAPPAGVAADACSSDRRLRSAVAERSAALA